MKNNFDLNKNIIVFYHEHCTDGFTSAYVAFKKFKNRATYIPLSYTPSKQDILKSKNIKIKDLKDKEIYFIDFCLEREEISKVETVAKKLVVLDHHFGAKDTVLSLKDGVYIEGESGALIAQKYFFGDKNISKLINYVSIGDTWKFSPKEKVKLEEQSILAYIYNSNYDFKSFSKLEKDLEDKIKFKEIKNIGEILQKNFKNMCLDQIENAKVISFEGYKVNVINSSSVFKSELGNMLSISKGIDFCIVYFFEKDILKLSFRGDGKIDLSEVAKKFMGGGHRSAAAVRIDDREFIMNFIQKVIS